MTSDWAKNLAARKKLELEKIDRQAEKDLSDRKFVADRAEDMWDEVCQAIQKYVNELNSEMGREYITIDGTFANKAFALRTRTAGTYSVGFSPIPGRLTSQADTFTLAVIAGNGIVWKNSHGANLSSDNVAQVIVAGAFG